MYYTSSSEDFVLMLPPLFSNMQQLYLGSKKTWRRKKLFILIRSMHCLASSFTHSPNLVEVCMKIGKLIPRICQCLAHISRLLPNQIKVKFDQDIKDSAAGGELNRFIRCPSVDHVASKFSQPNMRAIF